MADISKITIASGTYNIKDDISRELAEKESKNKKYMGYIFCDNEYRQSVTYVRELLTRYKNAGFSEMQMLININSDGTIVEDETKLSDYNDIADELNIPITSVKFHGPYNSLNYQNIILRILNYFPNCKTVFCLNEQSQYIYDYFLGYPSVIKTNYPNIEKVGFTVSYNQAFWNNNITLEQWNTIVNVFDVIGVHIYPMCSNFNEASNCSYEKVLEAFNNPSLIIPWTKEIWITESGVLPYWQFMNSPEQYNLSLLTDNTFNINPQYIFYRALSECNISQKARKIIPWFIESGMSDPNHELFDILENIIKER